MLVGRELTILGIVRAILRLTLRYPDMATNHRLAQYTYITYLGFNGTSKFFGVIQTVVAKFTGPSSTAVPRPLGAPAFPFASIICWLSYLSTWL